MDDRKGKENPSYMKNRKDKRGQMAPLYGLTGGQVITVRLELRNKRTQLLQENSLVIVDTLQQIIAAIVEKKNKQKLQHIAQQLNDLKQRMTAQADRVTDKRR